MTVYILLHPTTHFCVLALGISSSKYRSAGIICCSSSLGSGASLADVDGILEIPNEGNIVASLSTLFFRLRMKKKIASAMSKTPLTTPIAIPTLAPVERPEYQLRLEESTS
jgi:hypothetical protein